MATLSKRAAALMTDVEEFAAVADSTLKALATPKALKLLAQIKAWVPLAKTNIATGGMEISTTIPFVSSELSATLVDKAKTQLDAYKRMVNAVDTGSPLWDPAAIQPPQASKKWLTYAVVAFGAAAISGFLVLRQTR